MTKDLEVILSEEEIKLEIKKLAKNLDDKYKEDNPVVIGIIKGAIYFLTELTQNMKIDLEIELMGLSSYGLAHKSSGNIKITKDLDINITNRKVIVVEDIVDTGLTLEYLKKYFKDKNAKSVETVSLFMKEKSKKHGILPDRVIFDNMPNDFLVGFGLDYAEKYRNLKDLCKLEIK